MNIFSKKKILVVEDESQLLEAMRTVFSQAGYDFEGIVDGSKVASSLQLSKPDLIILDVSLPSINGVTILKYIREELDLQIPILVFTNMKLDQSQLDAVNTYEAVYMEKVSTSLTKLVETVKNLL